MSELVSIITPSYNTVEFIKSTIDSVRSQSYTNWEMLVIDDCSTDDSATVIKDIIRNFNDERIKLFVNSKNSGAAVSRNKALALAKGKWIAFLDSDDLWKSDKLEKQITFMKNNGYHFSYTNYSEIDENSKSLGKLVSGPKKITKVGMYNYCWPGCLTVMYNADTIGIIQINDIKKNNDYAIWLKVIKKSNCYLLDENLAKYRKRKGSISNHSYYNLIKYHYLLFRKNENMNKFKSLIFTIRNLLFGILKKIKYVNIVHDKN
ncbi:glycosyltransferase family 2 protein [Helicovermis profundi]|uniref:Glycosyltransferase family 2 protein n=1 Tax=Helicovermis profundi TaxID=3065157 RepID=A0AAU9EL83_9FIRM|nr:glycosyltransferase family 2 protein [Clostridia bacterium S502]